MELSHTPLAGRDQEIEYEISELSKLYDSDGDALRKLFQTVSFEDYAEYVLSEDSLEIVCGGISREMQLIQAAKKLHFPGKIVEAFKKCVNVFSGKMVYMKYGLRPDRDFPTLYLEMMEPWDQVMPFLETLPDVTPALGLLRKALRKSRTCILLAFSLDRDTRQLLVKVYFLSGPAEKENYRPLMVAYRISRGQPSGSKKYYNPYGNSPPLSDRLQKVLSQSKSVLKRNYWSLCGYPCRNEMATHMKLYIFRKDKRFRTWGPRTDSIYTAEGNTLLKLGRLEEAVRSYTDAITYLSGDYVARINRSVCFALLGEYQKSLADAREARVAEPDMKFNQAHSRFAYIEEVCAMVRDIDKNPSASMLNKLGVFLFSQGLYREAKKKFEAALHLNQDLAEIHNNLGGACINLGQYEKAFCHCGKAIDLDERTDINNYMAALNGLRKSGCESQAPL